MSVFVCITDGAVKLVHVVVEFTILDAVEVCSVLSVWVVLFAIVSVVIGPEDALVVEAVEVAPILSEQGTTAPLDSSHSSPGALPAARSLFGILSWRLLW